MNKTTQQEAEELLNKFGKEEALSRASAIHSQAGMRGIFGKSTEKANRWSKIIDIIIAADGNKYPAPNKKQGDLLQ